MTPLETMLYWVREREAIRLRKETDGLPPPWTTDRILRDWRFCNVRREDDRVTRWIKTTIREPYRDHPHLWFMLCVARQLNWPDTLAALMAIRGAWPSDDAFDPTTMAGVLDGLARAGRKVFTGAYIVTAPSTRGAAKTRFVAGTTLGRLWRDRERLRVSFDRTINPHTSLRNAHEALTTYRGWGPFLAYQAVVDMRFCPSLLAGALDVDTWAAAGPGTIRGLNRLAGRPLNAGISQREAKDRMVPLRTMISNATGVALDLSDVPNVCCEFDKYSRVANGEGFPRARYVPGRGA